jgi:CRISPR-associated protein Cas8a1/Csx13
MSPGSLALSLFQPGMTALHRAGLAGLWMTLDYLGRDAAASELRSRATWRLTPTEVEITWQDDGQGFLEALCRYAYPITKDGLMSFAVLGDPMARLAEVHTLHTVMLDTFLQHPKFRTAEKGKATGRLTLEIDGEQESFTFRRVADHRFRSALFPLDRPHDISGWMLPGAVVRHYVHAGSTALTEPPARALALRFAPVGCAAYLIRHHSADKGIAYRSSLVVPFVRDLEIYAVLRGLNRPTTLSELWTAGPAEAALRFFGSEQATTAQRHAGVPGCQVLDFARLPWSSQQTTRATVLTMPDVPLTLRHAYLGIYRALRPRRVVRQDGTRFIDVSQTPELAAENLISGRPWWSEFTSWIASPEVRRHVFEYEREGIAKMLEDGSVTPDGPERAFVQACHEAWHSRLGELNERARREGLDRWKLFESERDRVRAVLARCKTQADFSAAITDFWARAGTVPTLQRSWSDLLPFLDSRRWQAGRDLALLALASYRSEHRERALTGDKESQEGEP